MTVLVCGSFIVGPSVFVSIVFVIITLVFQATIRSQVWEGFFGETRHAFLVRLLQLDVFLLAILQFVFDVQVRKVSQRAFDDPLHAVDAIAVLELYSEDHVAIAWSRIVFLPILIQLAIRDMYLQLFQKNRNPFATMFVP